METAFIHSRFTIYDPGGQGRNRTADAGLFRAALYQLSYLAGFLVFTEEKAV